jgi:hypothetical protein
LGLAQLVRDGEVTHEELAEDALPIDGRGFTRAFLTMVCGETRSGIEMAQQGLGRKATSRDFEPAAWAVGLLGSRISAAEFAQAIQLLHRTGTDDLAGELFDFMPHTPAFNTTG